MLLKGFIERSLAAPDVEALRQEFVKAMTDAGYPFISCIYLGCGGPSESPLPVPVILMTYPVFWQQHYIDRGYHEIDAVVARAPQARRAYAWTELKGLSPTQRRIFDEGLDAGLLHGISIPIHCPNGEVFLTSIASPYPDKKSEAALAEIKLMVAQFYDAYIRLVGPPVPVPVVLTDRERECLLWSARGKSSADISGILPISEGTATFHLRNAMGKLGVSSRMMAVLKAVRLGLIAP